MGSWCVCYLAGERIYLYAENSQDEGPKRELALFITPIDRIVTHSRRVAKAGAIVSA